ncbi:ferritin-like domain-containing protein [Bosea sp. PAMC 26642]|uniref:ferritin-like domain-containing protein n=1 Tax=Bosea sp. (strain PAMC 26642) TaxID=1792307 RepID=UPI0007703EF9|nr:ferritin-like domain-containing protein [Bosea sp. PAMC 26642]AMJ62721.1 hypothetical protein AXW83_22635 [Bosea sp. PAMC 26642]
MTIETDKNDTFGPAGDSRVLNYAAGRRAFLATLGLGAAAAFTYRPTDAKAQSITDNDILNFALNLEYLEAEFYLRAAFGRGLSDSDVVGGIGTLGPVSGGRAVDFTGEPLIQSYAREIAADEENHVKFIRRALGGANGSVARPQIDLNASFTALARAAGLVAPNASFDAFGSVNNFLLASFVFEDVGVTAYKGASPLIQNRGVLEAAAGLLAVEAYHAGLIRTLCYVRNLRDATTLISNFRDSISGAEADQGVNDTAVFGNGSFVSSSNIVPTDDAAIAFSRTPAQVLNIVYANPTLPPKAGGFFPFSMNGNIR